MIEVAEIILHEANEPDFVGDLFDADAHPVQSGYRWRRIQRAFHAAIDYYCHAYHSYFSR